jgi:transglutaminase-like putative cysteine protease
MPLFNIRHVTRYSYEQPVRDSANQIILFPLKDTYQEVTRQDLKITGEPPVELYEDYYGNTIGSFTYAETHREMVIDSHIEVTVTAKPLPADDNPAVMQWRHLDDIRHSFPYIDFIKTERFDALGELQSIPEITQAGGRSPLAVSLTLNEFIFNNFTYNSGVTDVETTLDEVWTLKAGVCQDFAHVLLVTLHTMGIPARYVSGYICPNKNGMRGEGATHAWVEAYIPFYGWLGLDPTNNCIVNDLHVRLATGRSFGDVSPVKGTYRGTSSHVLEVGVTISYEDGSITGASAASLPEVPLTTSTKINGNSYRHHLEMMQQQQQQ